MENMVYEVLSERKKFIKKKIRSFKLTIWVGPLIFFVLNFLFVARLRVEEQYAFPLIVIASVITSAFWIVVAQRALEKVYKVILKIDLGSDHISFETKKKEISLSADEFTFVRQVVSLWGQEFSALVVVKNGASYYLVDEFFTSDLKTDLKKQGLI